MKRLILALVMASALASVTGCREARNDDTGRDEKQERLDTARGTRAAT
jgi:hypothetical protein